MGGTPLSRYNMKYFTEDWCFSNLDDNEIEENLKSYRNYICNIYNKLPFVLKILAKGINLHDGKITSVAFIKKKKILNLNGIFGDLEVGYFLLKISYLYSCNIDASLLSHFFENQEVEILSDEIEMLEEKLFSHRMLFSNRKYIEIQFKDIEIAIQNESCQNYKSVVCALNIL